MIDNVNRVSDFLSMIIRASELGVVFPDKVGTELNIPESYGYRLRVQVRVYRLPGVLPNIKPLLESEIVKVAEAIEKVNGGVPLEYDYRWDYITDTQLEFFLAQHDSDYHAAWLVKQQEGANDESA